MSALQGDYRDVRTKLDRLRISFLSGDYFRSIPRELTTGQPPTQTEINFFLAACILELDDRLKAEEQFRNLMADNATTTTPPGSCSRG